MTRYQQRRMYLRTLPLPSISIFFLGVCVILTFLYRFQLASVNSAIIDPTCGNLRPGEVSPVQKKNPSFFVSSRSNLFFLLSLVVQVICLGLVGQDCKTVHVVQNGDSCPTIASQANITTGELLTDNPNVSAGCTNIYVGEVKEFLFFFF